MGTCEHRFLVVRTPQSVATDTFTSDAHFIVDKVVLENGWYQKLTGEKIGDIQAGAPWNRRVIRVERKGRAGFRTVRLLFWGGNSAKFNQQMIGLGNAALHALAVRPGDEVELTLSAAEGVFNQSFDKVLFWWYHPNDTARVAFKLGMLGVGLGIVGLAADFLDGIFALLSVNG